MIARRKVSFGGPNQFGGFRAVAPSWTMAMRARVFRRIVVLDDIAAINNARCALLDEFLGAVEDFGIGRFATAADQHGDASGDFDDLVIPAHVVGRIGLDDIRAGPPPGATSGRILSKSPSTI